jgi:type II secretory pathway pseudopilin PulG
MPRGATLLECVVALGVLSVAFAVGAQALGWSAAQRRLGEQRHVALQEAANCLERVRQLKWDELTKERLAEIELSLEAAELLTSSELAIHPEAAGGDPRG